MLDLGSANAEGQCAESPMRAGVTVTTNDGPAGLRQPQFRTNYVNDALTGGIQVKQFNREFAQFLRNASIWESASTSVMKERVSCVVGTLWSMVAKVNSGRRTLLPAIRNPSNACGDVTSCTRCRSI